jgi:hypothetical protein
MLKLKILLISPRIVYIEYSIWRVGKSSDEQLNEGRENNRTSRLLAEGMLAVMTRYVSIKALMKILKEQVRQLQESQKGMCSVQVKIFC